MSDISLPTARYISVAGMIRANAGGQTRAYLMRNRLFATHAGIAPTLLTFDPSPVYDEVRQGLREQGQLVDPMQLLNVYEWHRQGTVDHLEPLDEPLPEVQGMRQVDTSHPDGSVYYTSYVNRHTGLEAIRDYRRFDGSVFLRVPAGASVDRYPATPFVLVNSKGQPVGRWQRKNGFFRHWLRELCREDERVVVISDSRFALSTLLPLRDSRFHVVHLMHSVHLGGDRRWNSPLAEAYPGLFDSIPWLDGLVSLTDRQRQDVAQRYGDTDNLFVVPNPVESPPLPDPLPARDPKRFATVTRLEPVKRLSHMIDAWALVLEQEPEARLDIYGDGILRATLQEQIDRLGVGHAVVLRGHDTRARDALWRASGFLMTSQLEGYPLATLESMSHGCPVVSYDIKYGPREQITEGVDGFLVPPGDKQMLADRIVQLARDPELVARMSTAAREKALAHGHEAFLRDWAQVVRTVVDRKELRTRLKDVELELHRLGPAHSRLRRGPLRPSRRNGSASFLSAPAVELDATLRVLGNSPRAKLEDVVLTLDAVCDATGAVVPVPISVDRSKRRFRVRARFDLGPVFDQLGEDAHAVKLRLRLVWHNSHWQTYLTRPGQLAPRYEMAFADDGQLHLLRNQTASRAEALAAESAGTSPRA